MWLSSISQLHWVMWLSSAYTELLIRRLFMSAIGGYIQTGSLLHSKPIGTPVFKYRILLIEKFVHDAVPLGFASVGWLPVFCGVTFAIAVPLCGVTSGSVGWERASARIFLLIDYDYMVLYGIMHTHLGYLMMYTIWIPCVWHHLKPQGEGLHVLTWWRISTDCIFVD